MTKIEFDEEKSRQNVIERGISFEYAARIFEADVVEWDSPRGNEHRMLAVGQIEDKLYTVIYTWRGDSIRIISARRARKVERDVWNRTQNT